jgi:hypothetical protein
MLLIIRRLYFNFDYNFNNTYNFNERKKSPYTESANTSER